MSCARFRRGRKPKRVPNAAWLVGALRLTSPTVVRGGLFGVFMNKPYPQPL